MLNPIILALLLLACISSFAWGMCRFFVLPARKTPGMHLAVLVTLVATVIHLRALLLLAAPPLAAAALSAAGYLSSIAIFWWAIYANGRQRLAACYSNSLSAHLVTSGPYRWVRHPFYCSYLLAWLSGYIATRDYLVALSVAVIFVFYWVAASREERQFAASPLAEDYRRYRAITGQFFPRLPLPTA
jgi:protein-S-isoprenylcysteine O-methyltransferase Ste14